jgi:multidrug efflux pump subunit AcrB
VEAELKEFPVGDDPPTNSLRAPVEATSPSGGRVLQIGMWSNRYSLMELSRLAYWTIKARLLRVDGVADVSIWNERDPTFQVQADPAKMAAAATTTYRLFGFESAVVPTDICVEAGALGAQPGLAEPAGRCLLPLGAGRQRAGRLAAGEQH